MTYSTRPWHRRHREILGDLEDQSDPLLLVGLEDHQNHAIPANHPSLDFHRNQANLVDPTHNTVIVSLPVLTNKKHIKSCTLAPPMPGNPGGPGGPPGPKGPGGPGNPSTPRSPTPPGLPSRPLSPGKPRGPCDAAKTRDTHAQTAQNSNVCKQELTQHTENLLFESLQPFFMFCDFFLS